MIFIPSTPRKKVITKEEAKTIAVDFDGTIHDVKHPIEGRRMGGPMKGAKEALEQLKNKGYRIIVFCYWASQSNKIQTIKDWMNYYQCPFDEITNIKPNAVAFIDDKGIRFTNWKEVLKQI